MPPGGRHNPSQAPPPNARSQRASSILSASSVIPPRHNGNQTHRSSPRFSSSPGIGSTSRATARVPTHGFKKSASNKTALKLNLCFFCKQGGFTRVCALCNEFASCISQGAISGCLPEAYLCDKVFICPACYKTSELCPTYIVPSRSAASSHQGLNTDPLVFYIVFLDEGAHSRAPAAILEGQARGYYAGKEEQLLFISHAFNDIANEKRALGQNMEKIAAFTRRQTTCRFIFLLQTHADPSHGGLHYATEKTTDIHELVTYLIGSFQCQQLSNAVFLLTTCGYFVERHLCALQAVVNAVGFKTCISFTGRSLDPLLIAVTLYYNVFDFHVVGNELIRKAVERSACCSLLSNTSVIVLNSQDSFSLCGASIRYRPNGEVIYCSTCAQPAEYYRKLGDGAVIYRCRNDEHPKAINRCQVVPLKSGVDDRMRDVVGGFKDRCRYVVTKLVLDS